MPIEARPRQTRSILEMSQTDVTSICEGCRAPIATNTGITAYWYIFAETMGFTQRLLGPQVHFHPQCYPTHQRRFAVVRPGAKGCGYETDGSVCVLVPHTDSGHLFDRTSMANLDGPVEID
jgi:hypothetical protein